LFFQNADGVTRRISARDLLGFLGISVGTEAEVQAAVVTRSDPMVAFITNGRKVNHVQGAGTFAEGAAAGSGVLAQLAASNTDWESLANGEDVVS
jgi:bifunctional ADP-heptose synthase (sugar kinase/adenylyltransferase)